VLGGSCVTFNDVALPLLSTSAGQIQTQIPNTVTTGSNEVQVRSKNGGTSAIDQGGPKNRIVPK
jgi:uncharacterized protein (TIGR03437 family)